MRKLIKNNLKVFVAILITAIICISGTVYAAIRMQADEIGYKDGTVEDALNDLYGRTSNFIIKDLITKTTANNECYRLDKATALMNVDNSELFIRIQATKISEDCNAKYTLNISDFGFTNITFVKIFDLDNNSNFRLSDNSTASDNISIYADTNYGYGNKSNYNYVAYYKYSK